MDTFFLPVKMVVSTQLPITTIFLSVLPMGGLLLCPKNLYTFVFLRTFHSTEPLFIRESEGGTSLSESIFSSFYFCFLGCLMPVMAL
jgi:hypothetical protein